MYTSDLNLPVNRLQLSSATGKLVASPNKDFFLRGPIPLDWLSAAAQLPGKTLNVGVALWWLKGDGRKQTFQAYANCPEEDECRA